MFWSASQISNIENGKATLNIERLERLAAHLKVHPLQLIADLPDEFCQIVDALSDMTDRKSKQVLKLFRLSEELMKLAKEWES
jgi:transcriptional regulator with XRE-family HTH domain